MAILTREEYARKVRLDQLQREGPIAGMIANALSVKEMTPAELISCLISEPYNLRPVEENLQEITRIINQHERLFKVRFRRPMGCFSVETILSL